MDSKILAPDTVQWLQERRNINRGKFTVILIGKDGGIKMKRDDQTRLMDIFALINAMPRRREEIRQKAQ